jgi:hypothetical protein
MANQELSGTAHHDLINRPRISGTRANWLHSIIAGAAMLVSSLGVVLAFDWYFFSVIDGLSTSLRPIAGALRHVNGDATKFPGDARDRREQPSAKAVVADSWSIGPSTAAKAIAEKSDQAGDQAESVFAPIHSATDSKIPAN